MAAVSLTINLKTFDQSSSVWAKFQGNATQALGSVEKSLQAADKAGQQFTRTNQMLNQAAVAVGVGIAAYGVGLNKAFRASAELDQAMRNTNSIAKLNEQQFQALTKSVKALAGDSEVTDTAQVLAQGLYDIYSSGLDGANALAALEIASKGASAGMSDTATASRVLVAAMNAYGQKGPADAQHFMDVMFKTVERGVVTFPELASQLGDVLGVSAQLGVPIESVGAAISTMTKQGIGAAEATTSLNRILTEFLVPSKAMGEAIAASGYESGLAIIHAKGLAGAIEWLTQVTGGDQSQMALMLGEVRAVRGAMALTGNGAAIFAGDMEAMGNASGAMGSALDEQSKGALFRQKVALKDLGLAWIAVGDSVRGAFAAAAPVLGALAKAFAWLVSTPVGKFLTGIIIVLGGVGLALAATVIFVAKAVLSWNQLTAAIAANAAAATAAGAANVEAGAASAAGGAIGGGKGLLGKLFGRGKAAKTAEAAAGAGGVFGEVSPWIKRSRAGTLLDMGEDVAAETAAIERTGLLAKAAETVASGFKAAGAAVTAAWGAVSSWASGLGALIGPAGLIALVVLAVAGLGYELYKLAQSWKETRDAAKEATASYKQGTQAEEQAFAAHGKSGTGAAQARERDNAKATIGERIWGALTPGMTSKDFARQRVWNSQTVDFGGYRAGGGPVSAGMGYVVGEAGREFFVPQTSGFIVPSAGGAGSASGGGGGVITVEFIGTALEQGFVKISGDQNVRVVRTFR